MEKEKIEEKIRDEKPLEEYDYNELDSLKWKIKELPTFLISEEEQSNWFNKITKMQTDILDIVEKNHSKYSRKEKVEKYINYLNTKFGYQHALYIENEKVWDGIRDRFPCEGTIDEYYMYNRAEIEKLIDKVLRVAPLTKEQLEQLVLNDEKIYFWNN